VSMKEEVPLESVTNVIVYQDVFGRIFGFGTVRADTAGTAYMGISFVGVENPGVCAKIIRDAIRSLRGRKARVEDRQAN